MRSKGITLAILCLLVLAAATRAHAAVKDFATYLPQNTLVYFEIDNDPAKIKDMNQSASGRMGADPRYVKLLEDSMVQYEVLLAEAGFSLKEMGITAKDLLGVQQGGIAGAFWLEIGTMSGGDGSPYPFPRGALFFDLSTSASRAMWTKINAIAGQLAAKGKLIPGEETIAGIKARVFGVKDTHVEGEVKITFLQKDDIGIIALTPETMKALLVCGARSGDNLAKSENYRKSVGKLSDKRLTTIYFNIECFVDTMVKMAGERLPEPIQQKLFNVLKIDTLRSLAIGSWADKNGEYLDSFLYCPGMKCPLLQPFTGTAEHFKLIEGVSKYATGFVAMHIEPAETCKMIQNTFKQAVGEDVFNHYMQQLAAQESEIGFSVEKDLIASLGNEVLFAMPSLSLDLGGIASIMAVEVKDRAKVEKVIQAAIKGINALIQKHDTNGLGLELEFAKKTVGKYTIYYTLLGGAYCFMDKYLIIGSNADRIEQFIDAMNGKHPSITDKDEYKKARRVLGNDNNMFGYMNMEHLYRLMGLMYYLQDMFMSAATCLPRELDEARPLQPEEWPEDEEGWEEGDEKMPEEPDRPVEPKSEEGNPVAPNYDEEGCPKDERFEDDCGPCDPSPKMKAIGKLHAISRRMVLLASEYFKTGFFALKPEKDGLRLRMFTQ